MPAKSAAQKRLMDAAAHNPAFAKKVGIPSKVAKEFSSESKGLKFRKGGEMKKVFAGKETKAEEAKERKLAGSKAAYARAEKRYEGETMKKYQAGGMPVTSNKGGAMRGLDRAAAMSGRPVTGGPLPPAAAAGLARAAAPIAAARMAAGMKKGGTAKKMASGGLAAGHKSADGIASKGKTKAKQIAMKMGGKVKGCK